MSNTVRLVSGGTVHVRTGVIQGIGPQGPRGVQGNPGPQGEQGPIGETGPMGQILKQASRTEVVAGNPIAANTDTVVSFGSLTYDELAAFQSGSITDTTLSAAGDYLLSVWLRFDDAAASVREIWFQTGSTTIARTSRMAGVGAPFYVDLAHPYRAVGGEVVNVLARAGAVTAVGQGSLTVTRIGSGPPGPAGPAGPQGPVGATGGQGVKGDPGNANSGFATYAEMLPH